MNDIAASSLGGRLRVDDGALPVLCHVAFAGDRGAPYSP